MNVPSSIVFLPCSDIKKTDAFYGGLLGLPLVQKQGPSLSIYDTGYGYFGFCQYADGRPPLSGPKGVCLSINLADNDAVLARFEELRDRADVYKAPARHPVFPVYSFFLKDPDSYLVEYQKIAGEDSRG